MRLVSYNVRYFGHALKGLASTATSKQGIADAIASLTPLADVIALQEVETKSIRSTAAHRGAPPAETQLDAFMRHLEATMQRRGVPMPYSAFYFPAHVYGVGPLKVYTTGLAILVNQQTVNVLKGNSDQPFDITHRTERTIRRIKQTRIAAHLHLEDTKGHAFHLFNTHLSLPTPWAKEFWSQKVKMGHGKNQLTEARAVSDYAKHVAHREPYLIVGDFNSAPATPVYELLTREAKLQGAQEVLKQIDAGRPDSFSTAGFMQLRMHLDHIFGRGVEFADLRDTHAFGDEVSRFHGLSDHVPLITCFEPARVS
ncbi:MAG: endonuclease/exonuclease/phosphatase family protein [Myxococcaceae bacterium]|nr:endonuclease/exonuclease/phosphatase family protein [Myxococcaceae bacterium]